MCTAGAFRTFLNSDLVGTPLADGGELLLLPSERACQRACCTTAGCQGYSFPVALQLMSGGAPAPCYLMTNITQLVPNHVMASGVLLSVASS